MAKKVTIEYEVAGALTQPLGFKAVRENLMLTNFNFQPEEVWSNLLTVIININSQ